MSLVQPLLPDTQEINQYKMNANIGCLVCNNPIVVSSSSDRTIDLCQECIDLNIDEYIDNSPLTDSEIYELMTMDDPPPELYMTVEDEDEEVLSILYGDLYEYYNSLFNIYDYFGIDKYDPNADDELDAIMGSN